ncbi:centrosome-associated protein Alms1a isoform X3 [Drosophila virilis]|nr:actin cytoskeleton-regulatory complex protein PAN1 isoform X3 [Drosophila virilis]
MPLRACSHLCVDVIRNSKSKHRHRHKQCVYRTMSSNNSTNRKQYNDRKIQHTSRITPKIREYLAEMANERELELQRFMALSSTSPASSSISVGAHSSSGGGGGGACAGSGSGSIGVATAACAAAMACIRKQKKRVMPAAEHVKQIPIVMETGRNACASVEDLRTPTKGTQTPTPQMQTRKTQTPESALKSHKRLEWDPAADVGYRCQRAASASNISTLERSVLEAAMQPAAQRATVQRSNHSESDLNRLQAAEQLPQPAPAPPLASSTFVNSSRRSSQPTPTPTPVPSQSSRRESCATSAVSSFDYHHNSRPSTGQSNSNSHSSSGSCNRQALSAEELLRHVEQQRQERAYTAQLEQVLCNRRHMTRAQNKENQQPPLPPQPQPSPAVSSSSVSSSPPVKCDLDLGIDLLCSLVSKRSLSHLQKKQLIRDIAKRLACLDLAANSSSCNSRADSSRSSRRSKAVSQPKEQPLPAANDKPKELSRHSLPLRKDTATNTSKRCLILSPELLTPAAVHPAAQTAAPAAPPPVPVPVPAPRTRVGTPTQSPLPCSYASTSSGASNELVTQKTNQQTKPATTDEQAAMQEWLNPMTQSEIDYEEKQRQQRGQLDKERRTQLDWIETEISRLRTLQNLLSSAAKGIMLAPPPDKGVRIPIQLMDAVADAVPPPAEGNALSSAAVVRRPAPPAPTAAPPPPPPPPPPAPPLPAASPASRLLPRSKMATPAPSHSGSSESVCSFVQQRQRQFMAHYQNQQQQRLEQQQQLLLLQQHQQQQQQQLIQRQHQQHQQQLQHPLLATCHMQRPCQQHQEQQSQQQQQQYMQMQYAQTTGNVYGCVDEGAVYYQVVNSHGAPCYVQHAVEAATVATKTMTTTAAAAGEGATGGGAAATTTTGSQNSCRATSSTSSMLCISSEMSIPMSMVNACEATTTTTTTTHQYDDVACHQQLQLCHRRRLHTQRSTSSSGAHRQQEQKQRQQMLQVRPRGIAYVIQFSANGDESEILPESLSLQDHLQRARPLFCAQSKQRKAILNQMQLLRNARRRELDQLIENSSLETLDRRLEQLPPPVTSRVRIFSTREMKALTSKRCEFLPEVLAAQSREREERRRRSNRIMRDVFNRRLQRRVRRGKLSLNHSRTVI